MILSQQYGGIVLPNGDHLKKLFESKVVIFGRYVLEKIENNDPQMSNSKVPQDFEG